MYFTEFCPIFKHCGVFFFINFILWKDTLGSGEDWYNHGMWYINLVYLIWTTNSEREAILHQLKVSIYDWIIMIFLFFLSTFKFKKLWHIWRVFNLMMWSYQSFANSPHCSTSKRCLCSMSCCSSLTVLSNSSVWVWWALDIWGKHTSKTHT